jgi:hypothetical protein
MKIQKVIYQNDTAGFYHIENLFEAGLIIYSRKELFEGIYHNSLKDLINKYPLNRNKVKNSKYLSEIEDFIKEYHWGIECVADKSVEIAEGIFDKLEDYIEEFLDTDIVKIEIHGNCQGEAQELFIDKESLKTFDIDDLKRIFTDYFFNGENYLKVVETDLYGEIGVAEITEFLDNYENYKTWQNKKNDYESLLALFEEEGYTFLGDDYPEALKEYDEEFIYS